jgi:hypothetical protein
MMFCLTAMLRAFWNKPERSFIPPRKCAEASTLNNVGSATPVRVMMIATTTINSIIENPEP